MSPEEKDEFDRVLGVASMRLFDYIDRHGDMVALDVVDEEFLVISVTRRGQSSLHTVVITEPDDARKFADKLTEWADDIEDARQ